MQLEFPLTPDEVSTVQAAVSGRELFDLHDSNKLKQLEDSLSTYVEPGETKLIILKLLACGSVVEKAITRALGISETYDSSETRVLLSVDDGRQPYTKNGNFIDHRHLDKNNKPEHQFIFTSFVLGDGTIISEGGETRTQSVVFKPTVLHRAAQAKVSTGRVGILLQAGPP